MKGNYTSLLFSRTIEKDNYTSSVPSRTASAINDTSSSDSGTNNKGIHTLPVLNDTFSTPYSHHLATNLHFIASHQDLHQRTVNPTSSLKQFERLQCQHERNEEDNPRSDSHPFFINIFSQTAAVTHDKYHEENDNR